MLRNVIEHKTIYYANSLSNGSVYYIFVEDREYKVTYTDKNGFQAEPYKEYDEKGNVLTLARLTLFPMHIENLTKLKHGI